MTTGVLWTKGVKLRKAQAASQQRRGTSSAYAKRTHSLRRHVERRALPRSRTRPSLGPETRARRRRECTSRKARHAARPVGYRGRENLGNQEEPAPGSGRSDDRAARRVSSRKSMMRMKTEGGHGRRPHARKTRARVRLPVRRSSSCRSRQAASGLEYARTQRSKKSGGTSERGPSAARETARECRSPRRVKRQPVRRPHRIENGRGPA